MTRSRTCSTATTGRASPCRPAAWRAGRTAQRDGLKHYRERVWWDALTYAAAAKEGDEAVVRDKLDWESRKIALTLTGGSALQRAVRTPERVLSVPAQVGWRRFGREELEPAGGVTPPSGVPVNPFR